MYVYTHAYLNTHMHVYIYTTKITLNNCFDGPGVLVRDEPGVRVGSGIDLKDDRGVRVGSGIDLTDDRGVRAGSGFLWDE